MNFVKFESPYFIKFMLGSHYNSYNEPKGSW